jgi:hypothetical protein
MKSLSKFAAVLIISFLFCLLYIVFINLEILTDTIKSIKRLTFKKTIPTM